MSDAKYISFLEAVDERKEILFAKFSERISFKDKENAWKDIHTRMLSLGHDMVPTSTNLPPWKYLRDTVWSTNLKTRTLHKRDKKRQTGGEGGKHLEYNPVNLKVLEILGELSPIVEGLAVEESVSQFQGVVEQSVSKEETAAERPIKRKRRATACDLAEIDDLKLQNLKLETELKQAKLAKIKEETEYIRAKRLKLNKELSFFDVSDTLN